MTNGPEDKSEKPQPSRETSSPLGELLAQYLAQHPELLVTDEKFPTGGETQEGILNCIEG